MDPDKNPGLDQDLFTFISFHLSFYFKFSLFLFFANKTMTDVNLLDKKMVLKHRMITLSTVYMTNFFLQI
jgi:hypothetical protein